MTDLPDMEEPPYPGVGRALTEFFTASARAWRLDANAKETGDPEIAFRMATNAAVARLQAHMALAEVTGGGGG